jgi:beta-N-acetylhexosaminidase
MICALMMFISVFSACLLPAQAQTPAPTSAPSALTKQATAIVRNMSPQQKIGQLFMISFPGSDAFVMSDVADLITNYRVGGVFLRTANQNFTNVSDGPRQIAELANRLQTIASTGVITNVTAPSITATRASTATVITTEFVPMFIAMTQDGDGAPYSDITQGLTALPSQMSIGATWKPENAEAAGRILGNELAKIGVNVLIGPALDVLESPRPNTLGDMGTRVFGGDPYWVGQFGAAFTAGVHVGANNRVAVIAKHFPGLGASDRNIEDEIPTVQKSLEQLKQIELAPFFSVMSVDPKLQRQTVDGLLVSHIRYRGFQGNIRANTSPVSLDPQAHQALMQLPEVAPWRNAGGVTFSDVLGVGSVRRFYDPLDASFNTRRIARDAFLAGNDVLVLGNFALTNSWQEQVANIRDTIQFFRLQYVSDQQFAARVDAALLRIISLKLRLYGASSLPANGSSGTATPATPSILPTATLTQTSTAFNFNASLVDTSALGVFKPTDDVTKQVLNDIGKQSITLLSPAARELPSLLPAPPGKDDSIVFITDDRQLRDCVRCATYPAIGRTALQDIVLNLYGPRTTGQINPTRVSSLGFSDLADFTRSNVPTTTLPAGVTITPTVGASMIVTDASGITRTVPITRAPSPIEQANWLVISLIDLNATLKSNQILRDFLSQRADLLRDKRIIVFSFGAPYLLDATEISKITAYYGVYSRTPTSLEMAVRVLFGEFPASGSSPVSVAALNYSLLLQTAPDPAQVIPLVTSENLTSTQGTPAPLDLKIGDKLKLRAGPIIDRNAHVVPDGTPVQFILSYPTERVDLPTLVASTRGGMAEMIVTIERKGNLVARVQADQAITSFTLRVNIGETSTQIETIRPTVQPSPSPVPLPNTPVRVTEPPIVVATPAPSPVVRVLRASLGSFGLTLLGMGVLAFFANVLSRKSRRLRASNRWRAILWGWTVGWLAYAFVAMGVPGTNQVAVNFGWTGGVLLALVTAFVMILITFIIQFALQYATIQKTFPGNGRQG